MEIRRVATICSIAELGLSAKLEQKLAPACENYGVRDFVRNVRARATSQYSNKFGKFVQLKGSERDELHRAVEKAGFLLRENTKSARVRALLACVMETFRGVVVTNPDYYKVEHRKYAYYKDCGNLTQATEMATTALFDMAYEAQCELSEGQIEEVYKVLRTLRPAEYDVMMHYYGLYKEDGFAMESFAAMARKMQTSVYGVRRIMHRGLMRLRTPLYREVLTWILQGMDPERRPHQAYEQLDFGRATRKTKAAPEDEIAVLDLMQKSWQVLRWLDLTTVGKLCETNREQLSKMHGVTQEIIIDVTYALKQAGLELKG